MRIDFSNVRLAQVLMEGRARIPLQLVVKDQRLEGYQWGPSQPLTYSVLHKTSLRSAMEPVWGPYCPTSQVCVASRLLPAMASTTTWTLIRRDCLPLQLIMLGCLTPGTIGTANSHGGCFSCYWKEETYFFKRWCCHANCVLPAVAGHCWMVVWFRTLGLLLLHTSQVARDLNFRPASVTGMRDESVSYTEFRRFMLVQYMYVSVNLFLCIFEINILAQFDSFVFI